MSGIIEQIKEQTDLAQLVGEMYTLTGREGARTRSTVEHDSLVIWTESQTWYWFSQARGGDVLDWYQVAHGCDLGEAIEALAGRAGIERRALTVEESQARTEAQARARVLGLAAEYYHGLLMTHPAGQAARVYCAGRGWTVETLEREMVGCTLPVGGEGLEREGGEGEHEGGGEGARRREGGASDDNKGLSAEGYIPLDRRLRGEGLLGHPAAKGVLSMPAGMVVYVHRVRGQVVAISGRSIVGKRHYHLPGEPTPAYYNGVRDAGRCLLVEGQADAISLAQLGVASIALCGLTANDASHFDISAIALDADDPGRKRAVEIAAVVDPMLPILEWQPIAGQAVKDANDALRAGADSAYIIDLIHDARPALLHMAANTRRLAGELRTEAQRGVFDVFLGLDEFVQADVKPKLAEALGTGVAHVNRMIKARQKEQEVETAADEIVSPARYEHSAGGYIGGVLFEQCVRWLPDGSAMCIYTVRWPDGKIETRNTVDIGGVTYAPYPSHIGLINKEIVLFPEEAVPYTDQRTLLRDIQAFIHKYLDVNPFYERLAGYYVMFSWLFDLFDTLPYLRALGDYGTGKSRFLQTIGSLCYRPMFMGGATTVSPIFRILDLIGGTLIIDEADFSNSDSDSEIMKLINLGYDRRQGFVFRTDTKGDDHWPEPYNVYGPKILATRKEFQDKATESRCLTKRMSSARPRPGIPYILDDNFWAEARALRNQLLTHRLRNHKPIPLDNSMAEESIEPRLNQVMMALKATIDDPVMKEELTSFMIAYNQELIGKRGMQLPALVLQVIVEIFYGPADLIGQKDLSMQGIAERAQAIINEWDPDERVSARRITDVLNDDLGLTGRETIKTRKNKGRQVLLTNEEELKSLMSRWGVKPPEPEE